MFATQQRRPPHKKNILQARSATIFFSSPPCRGSPTRIFRIRTPATATTQLPCSIGENTANAAEKFYCLIRCRCTTPSPTACTSQNLHRNSKPPSILPKIEPYRKKRLTARAFGCAGGLSVLFIHYTMESTSPIFPSIKSTPRISFAGAPRLMTTILSPRKKSTSDAAG